MTALLLVGCGSSTQADPIGRTQSSPVTASAPVLRAHPQVVEPVAGGTVAPHPSAPSGQTGRGAPSRRDPAPTGPASATSAPAAGAPTDAEIRAEVARFRLAIARYHLDRLNLAGALLDLSQLPAGQYLTSIASVYTDYGLPLACGGVLQIPQLGVANKTLPCGTEVIFRYGGRAIRVPVIDRGPYITGREWDLTGAAAEALHFPGLGAIKWRLG